MDVLVLEAAYQYLCNHNPNRNYMSKREFCNDMHNVRMVDSGINTWLVIYRDYDSRFDYENRTILVEYNERHDIFTVTEVKKTEVYKTEEL